MQLLSTFENTIYLEMAISILEKKGIKRENIFAVPLDNRVEERKLFDSIHKSDGTSLIDIAAALATAFSVIGVSIGFKLAWGPIFSGLIAAFIGFVIGLAIRLYTEFILKKRKRVLRGKQSEVILIIECEDREGDLVENILWEHLALGVAKVI
ncbi:hypothetical protein CR203_13790 [Salipaludibacillus neizhouensis]|uniref:Uncharacterized protein n=1 Tax=Salipaludibacillus neizhouensis TaxID=885475 RepID=A0A3A9KQE6_9BACI|nr:hypothetical protein [Salipaludibacillus neizhouensis]RKL66896.1 hypothetical protein CR203_13790 [Salipaludibacillus neizhouensis]